MNAHFDEAEVSDALGPELERCAQDVLEFMSACGVRFTTVPPRLLEVLTAYGYAACGVGRSLARAAHPVRSSEPAANLPSGAGQSDESGVRPAAQSIRARRTDPSDVTRKVVLLSRHGS